MAEQEPGGGWKEALGEHASNPPNGVTVGDTFEALGKTWRISSIENRIKAQFEEWVQDGAKKAISQTELSERPEEANRMRDAYLAAFGAKHYSWEGRHCRNARGDLPGLRYLLYLLLRRCQGQEGVTEDVVDRIYRDNPRGVGMAMRWALGNPQRPAESGTAGQETITVAGTRMTRQQYEAVLEKVRGEAATPVTMDSPRP